MNLAYLETGVRRKFWALRGLLLKLYLKLHGCNVGRNLLVKQWPLFRYIPNKNYDIGNNVIIGYRITFEADNTGKIILKDNVYLTQDILISSRSQICLEEYVSVAEFVSIRDHDHSLKKGVFITQQTNNSEPILIKKGTGILRGASVYRGVVIEEGVIIGSECILMRNFKSVSDGIYFGNPPKLIGKRS